MKTNCNIIQDLIPIVKDGIASEESKELVLEHLEECETCKKLYDSLPSMELQAPESKRDEKIIQAIRRTIRVMQMVLLLVGGLISISIGQSSGMFYNILLIPLLGILSGVGLKIKWYLVPAFLFAGEFVWYCIVTLLTSSSPGLFSVEAYSILGAAAIEAALFAILALLGRIVIELYRYAFRR